MYISKLEIFNFKSFEEVSFDFHPKVNLLTGVNNSGKTTALEGLALWFECYERLVRQARRGVRGKYKDNDYIPGTSQPFYISYQEVTSVRSPHFEDIFFNLRADPKFPVKIITTLTDDSQRYLKLGYVVMRADGDNYKIMCSDYENFDFKLFNDTSFLNDPQADIRLAYASPLANILPIEEYQFDAKIRFLKQSHNSVQVFRNRLMEISSRRKSDFDNFVSHLKSVLTNNAEDIAFDFSDTSNGLNIIVKIKIGRDDFKDISLLGSGTLQIMEILLSLFENKKTLNIVLLDEPDSHIHHALQTRLLDVIEIFTANSQIFLTTHNEALIRAAKPEWVFHLERKSKQHYKPILQSPLKGLKKGFQPSLIAPIVSDLTGATSLDLVYALEADKIILVEGEDDAMRSQKILSYKINGKTRYGFWAAGGVGSYFSRIGVLKEIFNTIRNRQSLWQKSVLIMDKDDMTDLHRQKVMQQFSKQLGILTHVWESYNFESVLLTELDKLGSLLARYAQSKNTTVKTSSDIFRTRLESAMEQEVTTLQSLYESESELNQLYGKWKGRRDSLSNSTLGIHVTQVFEEDRGLKMALLHYYQSCFRVAEMHKICRKEHLERILQQALLPEDIPFNLETDFDDLFSLLDKGTLPEAYNFLLTV